MAIAKKLESGTCIKTWNFEDDTFMGQTVAIKDDEMCYTPIVHVESVKCMEDDKPVVKNRIVIKKSILERYDFDIVEE